MLTSSSSLPTGAKNPASRALWIVEAGSCLVRDEAVAAAGAGEVMVKTSFSGISRGTENLVFNGHVPESEYDRMRGPNMAGEFTFPVKYGYAAVGTVVEGADDLVGKAIFCLHPHQDLFVVPKTMVTPLPASLPMQRAVLAANMETALNIVWDAGIQPGDKVAVFGAGVVGCLVAFLANGIVGTEVTLVDRDASRSSLATSLDIEFSSTNALDGEFDILINASGSPAALAQAIGHAGQEARLVEASWHGDNPVTLPLGGAFHSRRLSIISSQVGSIPATHRARWTFARRLAKALELLADDRLDVLISGETDFDNLAACYSGILANPQTLCHRIRY